MEEICAHCSPLSETKSEYEEWTEKGCQKAMLIIEKINTEADIADGKQQ